MQVRHLSKTIIVSNTAERLTTDESLFARGQGSLQAAVGNAARLYVGGAGVTSSGLNYGVSLDPIDSVPLPFGEGDHFGTQLNSIYVYGTAGDVVTLLYGR